MSRRAFLGHAAGVGLAASLPAIITSGALAGIAPSDTMVSGHIGVGGMGGGHLRGMKSRPGARVAAVSDVDEGRRENARNTIGGDCAAHNDFRQLLDRRDIDVVVIASPDHWHALHTILACKAGKDVYCEKPMMRTHEEGKAMVRAARRYRSVVQIGTQGRSTLAGRCSAEYIRSGYCGTVHTVKTYHYNNPTAPWEPPQPVPNGLDWNLWLGPAKFVEYHPRRCHGSFRWFMDFGAGNIRDRGAHMFSLICWSMNVDETGPVSVEATGTQPEGMYDIPTRMEVKYEFKDPDWTLYWLQPGEPYGDAAFGMKYFGTTDDLIVFGGDSSTRAVEKALARAGRNPVRLYESNDHMGNFLSCVRTRQTPIMDVAISHRATSLCVLGNIAYLIGRKLKWDPVKEEFPGDDEANRMLNPPYRPPWRL